MSRSLTPRIAALLTTLLTALAAPVLMTAAGGSTPSSASHPVWTGVQSTVLTAGPVHGDDEIEWP